MSDTVILNTTATGGKNQITASWSYSDPHQYGNPLLRHRLFRLERSTAPDMSGAEINAVFDTTWTSTVLAGVTLYHRVRSLNEYGTLGVPSGIFSGSEESSDDTPWSGGFSTVAATISVGAGSVAASGDVRYRKTGLTVFFGAVFAVTSLVGASGFLRVGNMPYPLRSGTRFAANASYVTGAGSNRLLSAAVVDAGGGAAAVDLYEWDGTFAGVVDASGFYTLAGFYETPPA